MIVSAERRAALALLGVLLEVRAARAHERELRRHEEPVEQDEHEDCEQQQDAHGRCAEAAPRRRAATSGAVVVVHQGDAGSLPDPRIRAPYPVRRCASSRSSPPPPRCCSPSASATRSPPSRTSATTRREVLDLPQRHARRDRRRPAAGRDRPRGARADRGGPRDLRARRGARCARSQPDLIVTQALCAVCAVSYDDVQRAGRRDGPRAGGDLARPAHARRGAGRRAHARRGDRRASDAGVDLVQDAAGRIDRVRLAVRDARAGARRGARVARPRLRRRPLDAAADRVRRRLRRARHARRALRGAHAGRRSRAAQPEVVVVMPCGYDAERALEEAYEFAGRAGRARRAAGRRRRRRRLLLAPRPAADRRPRAARRTCCIPTGCRSAPAPGPRAGALGSLSKNRRCVRGGRAVDAGRRTRVQPIVGLWGKPLGRRSGATDRPHRACRLL